MPWIPHNGLFTEETARKAAAIFNKAGERFAKEGITFFYHNHGCEFVPTVNGTLFDLLVAETKPEFVSLDMDVFWTVHPGQDPVKLLQKNSVKHFFIEDESPAPVDQIPQSLRYLESLAW